MTKNLIKYFFDRSASLVGLAVLFPLILLISLLVLWKDGTPIFFIQQRVGQNGRLFRMIKFRTMIVNQSNDTVSVKGDKRITKTGAWLRKYKLDELPELWNVLIGDMSMVGPRPDVPGYVDKLEGEKRLILKLRPGITGPATLKYAKEEEILASIDNPRQHNDEVIWPDKVKINLDYYYNHNFFLDLKIIYHTLFK